MAQETIKEMKKSVKGNMLIITIILMVVIAANVAIGLVLQAKQAEKNVESMLTDNLNGSYALVQKGIGYFGSVEDALTPEALNVIIANNSCDTVILDSSGKAVASYFKNGSALSSYSEYVQKSGQSLYANATGIKGSRMVYAARAIEGTGYTLLIGAPSAEYYGGLITSFWVSGALVAVVVVLLIITNLFFSKIIVAPLEKIRKKVIDMSNGNLSGAKIDIDTDDDLGVLASSVNYLAESTRNIIGDIRHTAEEIARENLRIRPTAQYNGDFLPVKTALEGIVNSMKEVVANVEAAGREVSSSSTQMSSNSAILSRTAQESSATVVELSSSLNNVHDQINNSTEKAALARNLTEMSVSAINEGNEKMSKMLEAMREINATSAKIANIIKTIQDISFQTNILSLNASIEAARAGAAGKGFAVVAGEVGSLAGKTAEAAKSTTKLIETSLKAVENGTVIANETAEMLVMMVAKANESAEVVEEIAQASTAQAESIQQTIEGMNRISASVAQVNSAAQDCEASSTMLASQSAMLENTVNRFVIDERDLRKATVSMPSAPVSAPAPAPKPTPAPKPASAPVQRSTPKPEQAFKPAPKIELPDDVPAQTAAPAAPKAPAAKPASLSKPAAKAPAAPAKQPEQALKPTRKIELPDDDKPKPAAPAPARPKPTISLPDDKSASMASPTAVKKATMQPVQRTVRMDPDKY